MSFMYFKLIILYHMLKKSVSESLNTNSIIVHSIRCHSSLLWRYEAVTYIKCDEFRIYPVLLSLSAFFVDDRRLYRMSYNAVLDR